jgi:S-DNA-T family DNA segregation ATPase FtsK/SpoIIIE
MEHYGIDTPYDPKLELSSFVSPTVDILIDYEKNNKVIDEKELLSNKDRIVNTLRNYKIDIVKISATPGPTVTLYEIVPAPGTRINKIKNLEDDIALSLSALGIRIIAPIPGKGTIGIEVPNFNPQIVSMKTMLTSPQFVDTKYELPIAIGKTISSEPYVADLAKMPHLLMAGATGQGKSVGLNAIISSLLFKKHPCDLKFVMVDPKKVELSLYSKIERHYLAKLPDSEEAIITDVKKVVRTLNSLCIEMDQRYDLLKAAGCKKITEYNAKFCSRRLLPTEGHRYMPYIVLVIDEFADLIMTAGKEIEMPIARLAQLARAVGIHLIIATQRPTVNIITGTIKANFPARIAFKVSSRVDSKTILDTSGAEQLIGRGDMLISAGSDLIRLQCALIDTEEIEKLSEYIGSQRGFDETFLLPEYLDETSEPSKEVDMKQLDPKFEESARLVVMHQHGSTSLIQRKLSLGYNRAGRIIDQLEAAGIVGPFEGSKAREVLVKTEVELNEILNEYLK